jgi:sulfur-carrier protein
MKAVVMIRVCYFGKVAERMNARVCDIVPQKTPLTLWALRADLFAGIDDWADIKTPGVLMSVNQQLERADIVLQSGDEVAFFSPFSGG